MVEWYLLDLQVEDAQLNFNGRMLSVDMPNGEVAKLPRLPIEVGEHDFGLRRQPPSIGAHTHEILIDAGLSETEIHTLASSLLTHYLH